MIVAGVRRSDRARVGMCLGAVVAAGLALGLPADGWAEQSGQGRDDRAELEKLQREVDTLRSVITQMLEIERMRVELLSQALRGSGGGGTGGIAQSGSSGGGQSQGRASGGDGAARTAPSLDAGREARDARSGTVQPASATQAAGKVGTALASDPGPKVRRAAPNTGVLTGRVTLPEGVPVAYVFVENVRGSLLKNKKVAIQQRNKKFLPEWAVVQVGTVVEFPNDDDIYHNVFSLTPGATFDLGLYRRGDQTKEYRFTTPGVVDIYCNIHPRMVASLLVVPNELVTRVKDDGTFELPGVPEGKRKIVAWAPGAELGSEWVDVGAGGETRLDLKLVARSSAHKNKHGQSYGSYD